MNDAVDEASMGTPARWLTWPAILALVAGLAAGGLALAAPAGIWLGLWQFPTGLRLLRIANGNADWIAGLALAITIAVVVIGTALKTGNRVKLAAIGLTGTLAAALGYYVPESYRGPDGAPPIHDVSTDTVDPPQYVAVLPLRADAANTTVYGGTPDMTPERLAEMQASAYPDVATRTFRERPGAVFTRALAAAEGLGWDIVAAVPEEGRIEATDTTFWFRFKDDIVIRVRPSASGSVLDARSVSRVGVGDAGTNARRLRRFLAALGEPG